MRGISSPGTSPRRRDAEQRALQRLQPARLEARLPQAPRGMQQVEVARLGQREALAVERVARLQQGHVEEAAVEGHDALAPGQVLGEPAQQRRLLVVVAHEVLPEAEALALDPAHAHEEGGRARAAGQARGLGVEEDGAAQIERAQLGSPGEDGDGVRVQRAQAREGHRAVQRLQVDVVLDEEELAARVLDPAAAGSAPPAAAPWAANPFARGRRAATATRRSSRSLRREPVVVGGADEPRLQPRPGRPGRRERSAPAGARPGRRRRRSRSARALDISDRSPGRSTRPSAASAKPRRARSDAARPSQSSGFVWFRWMKRDAARQRGQPCRRLADQWDAAPPRSTARAARPRRRTCRRGARSSTCATSSSIRRSHFSHLSMSGT